MTDTGEIVNADLGEERPRRVLVLSNAEYHRQSGRVLVAPELSGPVDLRPVPWHVPVEDHMFAVDQLRSLPAERVLERIGDAPYQAVVRARRALIGITVG